MASDNITWRKTPIDLLTDEEFSYISSQMEKGEECAPYMFYLTCLRKADEDGAFDLEDGLMFSRLMRIGNEKTVFKIANLMMQRKIITRIGTSTRCMLVEWDYPRDKTPRTMEQRRSAVSKRIESEKKLSEMKEFDPNKSELSFEDDSPAFSCPENDKKTDNVVNEVFDDKKAENVDKIIYDDKIGENVVKKNAPREIERENRDIRDRKEEIEYKKIDTHTKDNTREIETGRDREAAPPDFSSESGSTSAEETTADTKTETENPQPVLTPEDIPSSIAKSGKESDMVSACSDVFNLFFARVCKGYNAYHYRYDIEELVRRSEEMADEYTPADVVSGVICKCFEKLLSNDYYQGVPLQPDYLLKPGIWSHVIRQVTEILNTSSGNKKKSEERRMEAKSWDSSQVSETIDGKVYVGFDAQYVKYGIDPSDPNASHLLMQAMSRGQKVKEPP